PVGKNESILSVLYQFYHTSALACCHRKADSHRFYCYICNSFCYARYQEQIGAFHDIENPMMWHFTQECHDMFQSKVGNLISNLFRDTTTDNGILHGQALAHKRRYCIQCIVISLNPIKATNRQYL